MTTPIEGVLETCVYATDLTAAESFYADVLGLRLFSRESGRHVFFRCGDGMFLIFNPARTVTGVGAAAPPHGTTGMGHVAFRVAEDALTAWREKLAAAGISIEAQIEWPRGGRSLYVRDPAGNSVEIATPAIWRING